MYKVELYARVRRACMVDGMSTREAARVFGLHRDTVRKMLEYSVPPGLPPAGLSPPPQAGALHRRHRPDTGVGPERSQEAAPHGQADLRASAGRARVWGPVHQRQGLREGAPPPVPGDVRSPVPLPGARPVRLWRGPGDHRWGGAEGSLLRPRPAPQRRLLRQGLSCGDHRGLPGRPCLGVVFPGGSAPEHRLRQHPAGGGQDPGGRPAKAYPSLHRAPVPLPVRGPVRQAREGQRQGEGGGHGGLRAPQLSGAHTVLRELRGAECPPGTALPDAHGRPTEGKV